MRRFNALPIEERRRRVRLRLQSRRAKAARERVPYSGLNETAPEWFVPIKLPPDIETALGFDLERLRERMEPIREQFAAVFSPSGGGPERLKSEIRDLEDELATLDEEYDQNLVTGEELVDRLYPLEEPPADASDAEKATYDPDTGANTLPRRMAQVCLTGGIGVATPDRAGSSEEATLLRLYRRQQQILHEQDALDFRRGVAINVLQRYRRNLPLDFSDFYALFEVPEEDLQGAYAQMGFIDHTSFARATPTQLQRACEALDEMRKREKPWSSYAEMKRELGSNGPSIEQGIRRTLDAAGISYSSDTVFSVLLQHEAPIREACAVEGGNRGSVV